MPPKKNDSLAYAENFDEGLRTDVSSDKAPEGSLVIAENVRYVPRGGFYLRRGTEEKLDLGIGATTPVEQFGKSIEHHVLFTKCGSKIVQTKDISETPYDINAVVTAAKRGQFEEYNGKMKYTNDTDTYLNISVGTVKTQFTAASSVITLDEGQGTLFRKSINATFTAATSGDLITATGHGLSDGDRVVFYGRVPTGITADTEYFVISADSNTFQISTTPRGAALDITADTLTDTFTADAGTDFITSTSNHGLSNGDIVQVSSTTTLPPGLSASTDYYVINKTDQTFQVSTTSGGGAVDITGAGSGTHTWTVHPWFTTGILYCKGNLIRYTSKGTGTFTADTTFELITSAAHGLVDGNTVTVSNSGGALPTGLAADTVYFVISATTDTFKLSATNGGAAIDITGAGSGTHTFIGGDSFGGTLNIPAATYEVGAVVTQTKNHLNAPKGSVIESAFEKMVVSGLKVAGHVMYYSVTANIDAPDNIDDFSGSGSDTELFGKYGKVTAMKSLLNRLYVAKDLGIESWAGIDADGIPIREPFDESYGVVNADCMIATGNKLSLFTSPTRRIKTIEPDTTGVNPEPVINPFFDLKIDGTLRGLDISQTAARMGYNEQDTLMRLTVEKNNVLQTIIYNTQSKGFAIDTGYAANCWVEWDGKMYFGDATTDKIWQAESEYTDGAASPALLALTPIHFVGDRRRKGNAKELFLTGLIKVKTTLTVEIYCDGVLHRSVDLVGTGSYVSKKSFRPFGSDSIGHDPFARSGGTPTASDGYEFAVPIGINFECRHVQVRFKCQGTGFGAQIDSYDIVPGAPMSTNETQIDAI